jgi:hypothetical protein
MAYFEVVTLNDGTTLFNGSIAPIILTGASCSGTTLTTTGSPALTVGMTIYASSLNGNIALGTIVSGSANTWVVSIGGTFPTQTMTAIMLGAGSAINTTSYPLAVIQVTTTSIISLNIEGSNDGTNWFQLFLSSPNEPSVLDNIAESGLYTLKTSSLYIRYNLISFNGGIAPVVLSGASCSGTTLTTTGSPSLTVGMTVLSAGSVSLGTIVSGSANTWVVSIGGTFTAQTMTAVTGSASVAINILGRSGNNTAGGADNLSLALDAKNVTPIHVSYQPGQSGVKQDAQNAFVLSDAPTPVVINAQVGQVTIIDTQGYQTLQLTSNATFAASGGFQVSNSNDGTATSFATNQAALSSATGGTMSTAIVASTTYTFNCTARYVRIVPTTAGAFTYFLRNGVTGTASQNLTSIGGVAVAAVNAQLGVNVAQFAGVGAATGGLAGTIGVGGAAAVTAGGTAPTTNPVPAGIVDTLGFGRRTLGDIGGRTFFTGFNVNTPVSTAASTVTTAAQQNNPAFIVGSLLNTFQGSAGLNVQETSQVEGQTIAEILFQILFELKIANQQRYEMPLVLNNGITNGMDPPENYRQDPTAFTLQS